MTDDEYKLANQFLDMMIERFNDYDCADAWFDDTDKYPTYRVQIGLLRKMVYEHRCEFHTSDSPYDPEMKARVTQKALDLFYNANAYLKSLGLKND